MDSETIVESSFEYTDGKMYRTIKVTMPPCDTNDNAAWAERNDLAERIRALLQAPSQPAADCGLDVVAYRVSLPSEPELGIWLDEQAENEPQMCLHEPLVRKSDADARDAMQLERIAQLEAQLVGYDKLSRDANRYRWFRWHASESFYGNEIIGLVNDPVSLDRAIDARLNGGKPNE